MNPFHPLRARACASSQALACGPGSSPDSVLPLTPEDRTDEAATERQQPPPEDESVDPVGDGHSDADLAEQLPDSLDGS